MAIDNKYKRLSKLAELPRFAAMDHRLFLDKEGNDPRFASLPRHIRRKMKSEGKKIGLAYQRILRLMEKSGAGYPVDSLLRQLAIEYTNRYATSGIYNQPASFNYFESFCNVKLIENAAPYAEPVAEVDHLFSIVDYFDYLTSPESDKFSLDSLLSLPESKAFHFTINGNVLDLTFLSAEGREFVVAGFSLIRRGFSLHWYVLGGEVLSDAEWDERIINQIEVRAENIPRDKRPFLSASMEKNGNKPGAPIALEGTKRAVRTIIAGETDLKTHKHLGRCHMSETENSFNMICDDPDVFSGVEDAALKAEVIENMRERIESAGVMWNLAEAFFQLPRYFSFKISLAKSIPVSAGQKLSTNSAKGGRGIGANFRYVSALEFADQDIPIIKSYAAPHYPVETEGFWRRLSVDANGRDAEGNVVRGRTWIKSQNKWRDRPDSPKTIYVKSSVAAAKIKVSEYIALTKKVGDNTLAKTEAGTDRGVLYVLRCIVMDEQVYKVGWTSGTAEERAKELSSTTSVPSSFVVVEYWKHYDPEALEKGVHAMLAPYRINSEREFFKADFSVIKNAIETEIARVSKNVI